MANASGASLASNDVTVTWTTASCGPDVPLPPSGEAGLLYIGGTRVQYSDPIELAALLTAASGAPVAGRSLTFSFGGHSFTGVTDATGVARVAATANVAPAEVPVTVDLAAGSGLPALHAARTVTVEREDVLLEYTGKTLLGTAAPQPVSARLRDPDSLAPIAGRTVTFSVGAVTATAVTDANGVAATTITLGPGQLSGPSSLNVAFAGDAYYEPAFRTVAVTIYLSTSFVVWGGNTGGLKLGQRVNFWGAQWSSQVHQGDYGANASFKGQANPVSQIHVCQPNATSRTLTQSCWTSKGGQTWPPPLTLPAYIEVIVSTVIAKSGPDTFGNVAAAAVVKVDPQPPYGPDPGKPGYGVIVAAIEDSHVFPQPAAVTATQTQPRTVLPNQQITVTTTVANASTATAAANAVLTETLDGLTPGHGRADARHDPAGRQPDGLLPGRHAGHPHPRGQREPGGLPPEALLARRPRLHGGRAGHLHGRQPAVLSPRRGVVAQRAGDPGADARPLRAGGRQPRRPRALHGHGDEHRVRPGHRERRPDDAGRLAPDAERGRPGRRIELRADRDVHPDGPRAPGGGRDHGPVPRPPAAGRRPAPDHGRRR